MPPTRTLTFGYSGRSLARFKEIVEGLDALVLDIRILPFSKRFPQWGYFSLIEAFGHFEHPERPGRYLPFKSWGNRNRFCSSPMEIANWEYGLERYKNLPEQPVILMCACRALAGCHRGLVAKLLRAEGFPVSELEWPKRVKKSRAPDELELVP